MLCDICGKDLDTVVECAWTSCRKQWNERFVKPLAEFPNDSQGVWNGKLVTKEEVLTKGFQCLDPTLPEDKKFDCDAWDESRIDQIGQNGNNGEHYDEV